MTQASVELKASETTTPAETGGADDVRATLLVMTLNEIDGLQVIMPQIDTSCLEQVIVSDGGSTDGTIEWCEANGYEVVRQTRPGVRNGCIEALPSVTGNVVIPFSPDGNSMPEAVPAIVAKMQEGYDMVIASRYYGDAKSADDDWLTGFGNWMFTRIVNVLHGGNYTDAMVILRGWRKDMFYDLDLHLEESYRLPERIFGTVIGVEPLLSVRAAKTRMRCAEIGFDEPDRIGGERKLQMFRWGAAYLFQFFWEVFGWRKKTIELRKRNKQRGALAVSKG